MGTYFALVTSCILGSKLASNERFKGVLHRRGAVPLPVRCSTLYLYLRLLPKN